jgi:hypothetical protein
MSSFTMPTAVTSTLPAVNLPPHGHGHGHKKGGPLDPTTESSSSTTTPTPVGTAPNLLASLFSSVQQLFGAQPAPPATNPPAVTSNAAGSAATGAAAAAVNKINVLA